MGHPRNGRIGFGFVESENKKKFETEMKQTLKIQAFKHDKSNNAESR